MKKTPNSPRARAKSKAIPVTGSAQLQKVFEDQLKDIFYGEKNLANALPRLSSASTREELKEAYYTHLHETKKQVKRLDRVFELLGKKAQALQDVALLISGTAEQFEMAAYGSLKAVAGVTNMKECHGLIEG